MGYIKEPPGIDFIVDPTPLSLADRKRISEIIAYYKSTGRKMPLQKSLTSASQKLRKASTNKATKKRTLI